MPFEVSDLAELDAPDKEYLWTLNFGPQHPATHTTLRLILTLDGETVVNAVPHIGYLHSGFEKLGEHLDFNQYVTIVDRMNYISPLAQRDFVASRGRETAGHRTDAALQIPANDSRRIDADSGSPAEYRHLRPRPRWFYGVSVLLSAARTNLRHRRDGIGPAVPHQLHTRRRRGI